MNQFFEEKYNNIYIIYPSSKKNLFKEIKNKRVVEFWVEMDNSEKKREKFSEKIHFSYSHRKPISAIFKENTDETKKHFVKLFYTKCLKNKFFYGKPSIFPQNITQICPWPTRAGPTRRAEQ